MLTQTQLTQVQTGWTTFDNAGDKIGDIVESNATYIVVQKGLFLPSDIYVPLTAVSEVSPADQSVTLNVAKGDIDSMGWNQPPAVDTTFDTRTESRDVLTDDYKR
jgi:hypothetical protein